MRPSQESDVTMVGIHQGAKGVAHPAMMRGRDFFCAINGECKSFDRIDVFPNEGDDNRAYNSTVQGVGRWNVSGIEKLLNVRTRKNTHATTLVSWFREHV